MPKLLRIFITGMFISFLGSLPLGTLNVAAMQIAIYKGIASGLFFSSGCLLVEVIYVRLSLVAMDWVRKQKKLFRILEWVTLGIVVILAISSFSAAAHTAKYNTPVEPSYLRNTLHPLLLGFLMSAVNPVQIPFWFGWSTVLFTKKILLPRNDHYNTYIAGIALGTLFGNFVFVFGGAAIAGYISDKQGLLNWVIGGIFTLTALIQVWKMWRNKGAERWVEHPEEHTKPFEDEIDELQQL
ncbi:lysine transporter LysE [Flaviaesturariibacter flavus]|uniref:Lysine transporter LysE n=1 Tax=Flaviaesturariibacter flavus TaxID=2502780 RepID=A0A4R1BPS6_9BACT|nr:LysE family transporter [Flaviaesturariibacter flavus]TCJ19266.1 lysine transporter LysE [Flaviaesturariibacter flavus]